MCRASYCDIYNERLYDLLKWTQQPLAVRWSAARGFHVPDLALRACPSMPDLLKARRTLAHTSRFQELIRQSLLSACTGPGLHACMHSSSVVTRLLSIGDVGALMISCNR